METIDNLAHEITNEHLRPVTRLIRQYFMEGRLPCTCRECLLDVTALTLNNLRPRYSVSFLKELRESDDERRRYQEELRHAINVACARVRAHPHH